MTATPTRTWKTVSHHYLRRTARRRRDQLAAATGDVYDFAVERAERGPYRWRVVRSALTTRYLKDSPPL